MNILYMTGGYFPFGNAYASRTLHISRALIKAGHTVHVLADWCEMGEPYNPFDDERQIFGINYSIVDPTQEKPRGTLIKSYISQLARYVTDNKVDVVICASEHDRFHKVYSVLKKNKIPFILETCEWFGHRHWRYGILNPRFYPFLRCWYIDYLRAGGVIAISRLLKERYEKKIKLTVRIPTILDPDECAWAEETQHDDAIHLIYAGSAGRRKDLLSNLIIALTALNKISVRFVLDVYGIDEAAVVKQLGSQSSVLLTCKNYVFIHGRVKQKTVNALYRQSDYSVIFRRNKRASNAGFPTKLAESMMAGTPVICNSTSDLPLYVKNGINGVVLSDITVRNIIEVLEQIRNLSCADVKKMRVNARETAAKYFDYSNYVQMLSDMVETVVKKGF